MLNRHELVDVATVRLSALLVRGAELFGRSLDAPRLVDVATDADAAVGDVRRAGRRKVAVETTLGEFEAAYLPWQWLGPEYPTLIYHHGSGEDPFGFGRFSTNSFRRLFVATDAELPVNLVAVRAPFHGETRADYVRAMGDLGNFVGMVAAAAGLVDALVARASARTDRPVVLSGTSLGGFVANLHRACSGTADGYVPLLAGAALGEMFVSSVYRHLLADGARRRPARLRDVLDFADAFAAVDADDCRPLLGRYDRVIELDKQRPGYAGLALTVMDKGHVTGALATETLREHVLTAIPD